MRRFWSGAASAVVVLLLSACGGGGGDSATTRAPLATVVEDIVPPGARIDLRASNFFPMAAGDQRTYTSTQNGLTTPAAVTQTVSTNGAGQLVVSESDNTGTSTSTYLRTADGLVLLDPTGDVLGAAATALVGGILEFAEPFYPVGTSRRVIRQGRMDIDLDGDGINDSFRLEYSQVYLGLATVILPDATQVDAAHFTSTVAITLSPSRLSNSPATITLTDSTWWAPGIGLVRAERTITDSLQGVLEPLRVLQISSGTVGGITLFQSSASNPFELALEHNALVYDSTRRVYYASVPGRVVGRGNSIAIISADTGAVTYSAPVGSDPSALALDASNASLYVGLNGSGEVLRLSLPDLTELSRSRLPSDPFYGQFYAEQISVSPTAASVAAVSTIRPGVSPRHGGVVLLRNGVVQPVKTQEHTGSNLITFGTDGQTVFGYNNESTEFGLRRIDVLADGLNQTLVTSVGQGFGGLDIDRIGSNIVLGRSVFRQSDLAQLGSMSVTGGCRPLPDGLRLLCNNGNFGASSIDLAVVDAGSFVIRAIGHYTPSTAVPGELLQIVPGPSGLAAARVRSTFVSLTGATGVRLLSIDAMLQQAGAGAVSQRARARLQGRIEALLSRH